MIGLKVGGNFSVLRSYVAALSSLQRILCFLSYPLRSLPAASEDDRPGSTPKTGLLQAVHRSSWRPDGWPGLETGEQVLIVYLFGKSVRVGKLK